MKRTSMRNTVFNSALGLLVSWFGLGTTAFGLGPSKLPVDRVSQLAFTRNCGQYDARVSYVARVQGAIAWFTEDRIIRQVSIEGLCQEADTERRLGTAPVCMEGRSSDVNAMAQFQYFATSMRFIGANKQAELVGEGEMSYVCNYLKGNDTNRWITSVPNYCGILYKHIYPEIDIRFYGSQVGKLEYDLLLGPDADLEKVAFQHDGIDSLVINQNGDLEILTPFGMLVERAPRAFYVGGSQMDSIEVSFVRLDRQTVGFRIIGERVSGLALVIDPIIDFGAFLGGFVNDIGHAIAVDGEGCSYICGETEGLGFPTTVGAYHTIPYDSDSEEDVFVTKVAADGKSLIYSTYIGGSSIDRGLAIALGADNSALVTGETSSTNFPTSSAFDAVRNGQDAFVLKLNPAGNDLIFSTFYGGSGSETGYSLATDQLSRIYVVGRTSSNDLGTLNAFDATYGSNGDAFLAAFSPAGSSLIYATYLGGSSDEIAHDVAVGNAGDAYVTGWTASFDFPSSLGAFDHSFNDANAGRDVFVSKIDIAKIGPASFVAGTFLGSQNTEEARAISLGTGGDVFITGQAHGGFPVTQNVFDNTFNTGSSGQGDVFISRLTSTLNSLVFSTYFGNRGDEIGADMALDQYDNIFVTGPTSSDALPVTTDALQATKASSIDAFVAEISSNGHDLLYGTYLGGEDDENQGGSAWIDDAGITIDDSRSVYLTGDTKSYSFPSGNSFDSTHSLESDAFVTKISGFPISPTVSVNPSSLQFVAHQGGVIPPKQSFSISNLGGGTLSWTVNTDAPWLSVSPTSGQGNLATIDVSVLSTQLSDGMRHATVNVTSSNAVNTPIVVNVSYEIQIPPCTPNSIFEPLMLLSPAGALPYRVTLRTLNGTPIPGSDEAWLDFSGVSGLVMCDTPSTWPILHAKSDSDVNGKLRFYLAAGGCPTGNVKIICELGQIGTVPVRTFDNNGNLKVDAGDFASTSCSDYNGDGLVNGADWDIFSKYLGQGCNQSPVDFLEITVFTIPDRRLIGHGDTIQVCGRIVNTSETAFVLDSTFIRGAGFGIAMPWSKIGEHFNLTLTPFDTVEVCDQFIVPMLSDHWCFMAETYPVAAQLVLQRSQAKHGQSLLVKYGARTVNGELRAFIDSPSDQEIISVAYDSQTLVEDYSTAKLFGNSLQQIEMLSNSNPQILASYFSAPSFHEASRLWLLDLSLPGQLAKVDSILMRLSAMLSMIESAGPPTIRNGSHDFVLCYNGCGSASSGNVDVIVSALFGQGAINCCNDHDCCYTGDLAHGGTRPSCNTTQSYCDFQLLECWLESCTISGQAPWNCFPAATLVVTGIRMYQQFDQTYVTCPDQPTPPSSKSDQLNIVIVETSDSHHQFTVPIGGNNGMAIHVSSFLPDGWGYSVGDYFGSPGDFILVDMWSQCCYSGEGRLVLIGYGPDGEYVGEAELILQSDGTTAVEDNSSSPLPQMFALTQNYPNPFNPSTSIDYTVAKASHVKLVVVDILGHTVRVLVDVQLQSGKHTVVWDGRDEKGTAAPSGVYFCRMQAEGFEQSLKMLLLK